MTDEKDKRNLPAPQPRAQVSSSSIGRLAGRIRDRATTRSLDVHTELVQAQERLLTAKKSLYSLQHNLQYLDDDLAHEREMKEKAQAVEKAEAEVRLAQALAAQASAETIAQNKNYAEVASSENSKLHRQAFAEERAYLNKQLKTLRDRADQELPGSLEYAKYQEQIAETMKRVKELERDATEAAVTKQGYIDEAAQRRQQGSSFDLIAVLYQTLDDEDRALLDEDEQTLLTVFTRLKQHGLDQMTTPPTDLPAWREYLTKRQAELIAPWFTKEHLVQCLSVLDRWE